MPGKYYDKSVSLPSSKDVVSTKCKKCGRLFQIASILKHISHSKECKTWYNDKEILAMKKQTRKRLDKAKVTNLKSKEGLVYMGLMGLAKPINFLRRVLDSINFQRGVLELINF